MKLLLVCIFFTALNVQASFIAANVAKINPDVSTHILIAGTPDKLGDLFLSSILTKAEKYKEKSQSSQIIILGRSEDKSTFVKAGYKLISNNRVMLKADGIKDVIKDLNSIASIDIFAHSNAMNGALLDSNSWIYQILNEKDPLWDLVKTKTNENSFVFIHGCNAGVKFAPLLATKLKIAVMAALTSTDFQYIYNKHDWGFDYDFKDKKTDKKRVRMKPDNFSYRGYWGDWSAGGYPTYKLFCGGNDNKRCGPGALEAMLTFPGHQNYKETKFNLANYKKQLIEFMCPFSYNVEKQSECESQLENALVSPEASTYSPFKGTTLVCDRVRCKAHHACTGVNATFSPGSCELINEVESVKEESSSFADEYKYFVSIFTESVL